MVVTMIESVVIITAICTMYTASVEECGKADGITASGHLAKPNYTLAADHLPLGTKLKRLSDGRVYEIQDRFGAGHKDRIDIFVSSRDDAISYGRREETFIVIHSPHMVESYFQNKWESILNNVFFKGSSFKFSWSFLNYDI